MDGIRNIARYAEFLANALMGIQIEARVTRVPNNFLACYGHRQLTFNLQRLGHRWFNNGPTEKVDELLLHEFGHEFHLSSKYYDALCLLGARLKRLALDQPEALRAFDLSTNE